MTNLLIHFQSGAFLVPAKRIERGLALHRPCFLEDGKVKLARQGWQISHVESGTTLFPAAGLEVPYREALQIFEEILALADWTRPRSAICGEKGLREKVEAILGRHRLREAYQKPS